MEAYFDIFAIARKLEAAGMERGQAEATANACRYAAAVGSEAAERAAQREREQLADLKTAITDLTHAVTELKTSVAALQADREHLATKADLAVLETRLVERIQAGEERMMERMQASETRMMELMQASEMRMMDRMQALTWRMVGLVAMAVAANAGLTYFLLKQLLPGG